ncbi:DNA recombination protein RmuC [Sphingobacterium sp. SRCM116780]|uniref:DNA recombination protein RmuC n=1 Tax=Sphingobacterium sp. SRCM116780 TaxID=2907623 RepID=UPI001F1C0331|nr:DNA recombination protein RmuC [Sphingobacterium sp. SRCM116780]UIR55574.1 DNA recombination protein RmuC [Sphingobacterium sp. SRCM116780]
METVYIIIVIILLIVLIVISLKKRDSGQPDGQWLQEKERLSIELAKAQQREQSLLQERTMLREELEREREHVLIAERSLESTRSFYKAQQDKFQEQKVEIADIKRQFNAEFQVIANRILEEKTLRFTETNSKSIGLILDPLKEKIKLFEEKVDKTYAHEAAERNSLKGVVQQLMEQSLKIKDEAINLTRALKGDAKKQGNWGEVILERVLERSGLVKDREFRLQASVLDTEGRRMQPDAIIDLPENKHLIVDSKVSLVAYERWVNAETDEDRTIFAKQHILSIENHVKDLSAKNYHALYGIESPEFVLLFMPIESALSMSVSEKSDIFSDAWDRKVVIVSPSTLLATLRTIASIWKQERQTRNVIEIAKEAGALYDKFHGFLTDMDQVQGQLQRALKSHEDASKKLSFGSGNVIKRIENLKKLGAKASKQIDPKYLDEEIEEED